MIGWTWERPMFVHLFWVAIVVMLLLVFLEMRSKKSLSHFMGDEMRAKLSTELSKERRFARWVFIFSFLGFGIFALMRPQTKGEVTTVKAGKIAADIVIALDVSKSMLAEDAAPNRLSRAKAEISAMLDHLSGHRVGLVAFSGSAVQLCPLTPDVGFFNMMLRGASTTSVSRGGTKLGEALRTAYGSFDEDTSVAKMIVLITDGEGMESYPLEAAQQLADNDIRLVSIAFGSEEGSPIVITNPRTNAKEALMHNGEKVISRVDGELLREIALKTNGAFVPAGTSALDLESIVDEHLTPIVEETQVSAVRVVPGERYPWMILGSLFSLLLASWLGIPKKRFR